MMLIKAQNLSISAGDRILLDNVDFSIHEGERIGLVGRNGCGKTSLMRAINGDIAYTGHLLVYSDIAYIRQQDDGVPELDRADALDWQLTDRATAGKLGVDIHHPEMHKSGGEKARARITAAWQPWSGMLLADEPTGNLDIRAVQEVQTMLENYRGTLVLVSHDRDLLDALCTRILEIEDTKLYSYPGNYSDYLLQKNEQLTRKKEEWTTFLDERKRLSEAIVSRDEHMKGMRKAPKRMGNSEARLHKRETTQRQAKIGQSKLQLESRLRKLDPVERPFEYDALRMQPLPVVNPISRTAIQTDALVPTAGGKALCAPLQLRIETGSHVALIGQNGCGKSTLLSALAEPGLQVRHADGLSIGFYRQDLSVMPQSETILQHVLRDAVISESTARTMLARLHIRGHAVFKTLGVLSGGEKVKVSIARLLASGANCLLLDEPTNFLDIPALDALAGVLQDYSGTLIVVSHDRFFVRKVANRVLEMTQDGLFEAGLEDGPSR